MEILPIEIWAHLVKVSSLDVNLKLTLRCTNKYLHEMIDHRDFVVYFSRVHQLPEMARLFSRHNKPISLAFSKIIELNTKAINHLSTLTNLTELNFEYHKRLTKKRRAISGLTSLTNLRTLSFGQMNDVHLDIVHSLTSLTNLKMLDVVFDLHATDVGFLYTVHSVQAPIPLEKLVSLESLRLVDPGQFDLENCSSLTKLELLSRAAMTKEQTQKWTSLTNLQSISLCKHNYSRQDRTLDKEDFYFLTALSNLSDFEFQVGNDNEVLDLLGPSVTSLKFSPAFNASKIKRLTGLEQLIIDRSAHFDFLTALQNLTHLEVFSGTRLGRETITTVQCLTKLKILRVYAWSETLPFNMIHEQFPSSALNVSALLQLERLEILTIKFEALGNGLLTRLTCLTAGFETPFNPEMMSKMPLKVLHVCELPTENQHNWHHTISQLTALEAFSIKLTDKHSKYGITSLTVLHHMTRLHVNTDSFELNYHLFTQLTNLQELSAKIPSIDHKKLLKKLPFLYWFRKY